MKRLMMSVLLTFVFAGAAFADICTWTGAAGDCKWSTPGNWEGNQVPAAEDEIWLNGGGGGTITNDVDGLSVSKIVITNTSVSATVTL